MPPRSVNYIHHDYILNKGEKLVKELDLQIKRERKIVKIKKKGSRYERKMNN
jgi:hypothetical protein